MAEESNPKPSAVAAIAGALTLLGGTLLHPSNADPNVPLAAFTEYAANRPWVGVHLIQLAGVILIVLALILLSSLMAGGPGSSWARIGAFFAGASLAIAGALQAVDGVALKVMVDRWAAASGTAKEMLFYAAFGVRQFEVGFAGMLSLFLGITAVLYGVALMRDRRFSSWLGWLALAGGIQTAVAGVIMAHTGFSALAMMVNMPANLLLVMWMVMVGVWIWRMAPTQGLGMRTN